MPCRSGDARATWVMVHGWRAVTGALVAGLFAAGVLTACADDADDEFEWPDDPSSQSEAPAAGASETEQELRALVGAFRSAQVEVFADPAPAHEAQESFLDHVADPLLSVTMLDVETMRRRGVVREGEPVREVRAVEVDQDATPPTATVRECLDTTGWPLVDVATEEPAEATGLPEWFAPGRYVTEFEAAVFDGDWLLQEARVEEGAQC